MKKSLIGSLVLAAALPIAFAAEEPVKEKNLLQKTGDSLEKGAKKTGDKLKDLVTTSDEEKKKDAEADAAKKAADQKADKMKNDAKADATKKAADDKAEQTKGEKK
jgi:hypothetical protein